LGSGDINGWKWMKMDGVEIDGDERSGEGAEERREGRRGIIKGRLNEQGWYRLRNTHGNGQRSTLCLHSGD
jgi:hypothetical protein